MRSVTVTLLRGNEGTRKGESCLNVDKEVEIIFSGIFIVVTVIM